MINRIKVRIEHYINLYKEQRLFRVFSISAGLTFALLFIWAFIIRTPGYAVYVNGNIEFYVEDYSDFSQAYNQIVANQTQATDKSMNLHDNLEVKPILAPRGLIIPQEGVSLALQQSLSFKTKAFAIIVNDQPVTYVETEEIANALLNRLKDDYSKTVTGEKLLSVNFNENITVKPENVFVDQISSELDAFRLVTTGTDSPEVYTIVDGDNLWAIARRNDLYVKDIVQANNLTTDALEIGQQLVLVKSKPYINVAAVVEGEKTEEIPYDVKVINDPNSNSIKVTQEGQPGERHVVYQEVLLNGQVESQTILSETILKAAIDKIMIKGNALQVASRSSTSSRYVSGSSVKGSGNLDWPVSGTLTQYFRGGHNAIDIATAIGTPIRAADAGTVVFAGWQGGYGNFLIIDHGNGMITRYGHCQTIKVDVGDTVSKGQVVATLGSTGRSTGPHVHFEVISGGSFINPLNALK